jgi:hypothetical protein
MRAEGRSLRDLGGGGDRLAAQEAMALQPARAPL